MGHYNSEMNDRPAAYDETAKAVEMPLAQDVHQAINEIAEIDAQTLRLRKRRAQAQERIDNAMNEVQRHYSDVINGPQETPIADTGRTY